MPCHFYNFRPCKRLGKLLNLISLKSFNVAPGVPFYSKFTYAREWAKQSWFPISCGVAAGVKVFVSLCSYSTHSSKQIGAETFLMNNGERIIE